MHNCGTVRESMRARIQTGSSWLAVRFVCISFKKTDKKLEPEHPSIECGRCLQAIMRAQGVEEAWWLPIGDEQVTDPIIILQSEPETWSTFLQICPVRITNPASHIIMQEAVRSCHFVCSLLIGDNPMNCYYVSVPTLLQLLAPGAIVVSFLYSHEHLNSMKYQFVPIVFALIVICLPLFLSVPLTAVPSPLCMSTCQQAHKSWSTWEKGAWCWSKCEVPVTKRLAKFFHRIG